MPIKTQAKPSPLKREPSFAGYAQQPATIPTEAAIRLTDKELEEEQTRMLNASCPSAPDNIVHFSYSDRVFKSEGLVRQTQFHICVDGPFVYAENVYASKYGGDDKGEEKMLHNQFNYSNRGTQASMPVPVDESLSTNPPPSDNARGAFTRSIIYDAYKEASKNARLDEAGAGEGKKGGAVAHRKIGDDEDDPLMFTAPEGVSLDAQPLALQKTADNAISAICSLSAKDLDAVFNALSLAERLVAEILYADVISDYKFWDDPSDKFKSEGSLLPLWKFSVDFKEILGQKTTKAVSVLQFHPKFSDLFAVGYGTHEFQRTSLFPPSCLCVFSLKNPFYPERIIRTPVDVLCLDWHPERSDLLIVGLYDGNIALYNLTDCSLIAMSDSQTGKHTDLVWSVRWRTDVSSSSLSFFSASSDGYVFVWSLVKSVLRLVSKTEIKDNMTDTDVVQPVAAPKDNFDSSIKLASDPLATQDLASSLTGPQTQKKSSLKTKQQVIITEKNDFENHKRAAEIANQTSPVAGVLGIAFNPKYDWMYAITTDSGVVRLCSTAYHNTFVQTFCQGGHSMPVYGLSWNLFNPDILVSCSEDFTCKIWKRDRATPLYTIDFGNTVSDVAFNPQISTEIVAGTKDGKVVVYDFGIRQETPICIQTTVPSNANLTKLALSNKYPVVAVGDSQGVVRVFKLSPNLMRRFTVEQPKARGPNVRVYTPEELAQLSQEGEEKKLEDFVQWCIKANAASGID
ncbi:Dynein intermediate chain [Giardia muris]|uniref:Dynein intermediate chain n=1 Tax=Giardia muris TaxID=5742 RepID=A0A4Z1T780_GIAMU|nr:Dynein intermediate chain [Giardia muris]|eukprot:TNJ28987.1 Dynein intermediate chain [Giardia muris]